MVDNEQDSLEPLDSSTPIVSEIFDNAKEKAKKAIKYQEAENIIKMILKAGVPEQLIGWNKDLFHIYGSANVDNAYYGKPPRSNMLKEVYNLNSDWPKRRLVIIVDGGTRESRINFSHLILARAILGNFYCLGRVGATLPYSMLSLKFNSFDDDRQVFISNLLEIPALYISEVPQNSGFRPGGDGAAMMDQLLESKGSPVILSLATKVEVFEGSTTYGSVFRETIDTARQTVCDKYVWRFCLKSQTPCDDALTYKKAWASDKRGSPK